MTDDMQFRDWLVEQLRVRNMNRSQLARQINASPSLISRYINEDVKPGPIIAERIARVFRVDVDFVRRLVDLDPLDYAPETLRAGELIGMVKRVNWRKDDWFKTVQGILRMYLDEQAHQERQTLTT
jgi:Helix-turn-helix.